MDADLMPELVRITLRVRDLQTAAMLTNHDMLSAHLINAYNALHCAGVELGKLHAAEYSAILGTRPETMLDYAQESDA